MKTNEEFLKELNQNLSKTVPHKWRVQSFSKNKPSATVVAYIDARNASDLLNEYAIYGWSDEYYEVAGNTYCKVGIVMPDGSIMWRSDCGVVSNTDAEKGQASDAFKRACVKWGIGRFLYNLGIEYVNANEVKTQSNFPFPVDEQGKRIYDLTKYINEKKSASKPYSFDNIPATKKYLDKQLADPRMVDLLDKTFNNKPALQPNASFDTEDDRKNKALLALEKTGKLHDVKQLIKLQKDFKKTEEGKAFVNGASLSDVVKLNPIEMLLEFHKFLK